MITYFDVLSAPRKLASQSTEAYNNILCEYFGKQPVTPDRKLAYIVLTQQYDIYIQIHCTKTLYEVIGVPKTASLDEIKKAYRQLSLKVHPDRWMTSDPCLQQQAVKNQSRISVAFQVLSDRRAEYDKAGCPYDLFASSGSDDSDDEFNDDMWAGSGSEAEESDGMSPPPPKRGCGNSERGRGSSARGRGNTERGNSERGRGSSASGRGNSERGRGNSERGRGSSTRGRGSSARGCTADNGPPASDTLISNKIIVASLYQLYRGFTAAVCIETSVFINEKWILQTCQMQIPVPPRTAPGLIKVLKQAGVYRPGLHVREDVHISVVLDDAACPFTLRGQDIVVNHNIDLDVAIRGQGITVVRMPDNENEQFNLSVPIHELQEVSYQGRGLKTLHTGFVGCIILRFHIVYPLWTKEQRFAVADFIQSICDL